MQRDHLADVRREPLLVLLERAGHVRERARELADLVAGLDVEAVIEIAARDRDRAAVEPRDRLAQPAAHQRGEQEREPDRRKQQG